MNKKLIFAGLLTLAGGWPTAAQQQVLTMDEMFRLADANSKNIAARQLAVDEAAEAVRVAKNDRLPSIEASLSLSYIGDGWMADRDFSNGMKADMPHFGNNFALKATQVVYSGGAISTGIEMSELQKQIADLELANNRQDVRFLLTGYYLQLFQLHNQEEIYEKNIEQTRLLVDEITAAHRQGTALKSDITRYELQLQNLELGLTNTRNRRNIINRQLTTTLGLDNSVEIMPDTTLLAVRLDQRNELFWQDEMQKAPALQLAGLAVDMGKKQEQMAKAERRPSVALFASNNLDGPILIEVPPINSNFNYWMVGVSFSYKFDSLFKSNKKLKKAQIAIRKAQQDFEYAEEQLSNGVHASYIDLQEAYERLRTKEKSVQLAHENYSVVHSRYINGLSLITDMLDASNIQLSSELELANAQIGILYQYCLLKKTVGGL